MILYMWTHPKLLNGSPELKPLRKRHNISIARDIPKRQEKSNSRLVVYLEDHRNGLIAILTSTAACLKQIFRSDSLFSSSSTDVRRRGLLEKKEQHEEIILVNSQKLCWAASTIFMFYIFLFSISPFSKWYIIWKEVLFSWELWMNWILSYF